MTSAEAPHEVPADLRLTGRGFGALEKARWWARFLAVVCMTALGVMVPLWAIVLVVITKAQTAAVANSSTLVIAFGVALWILVFVPFILIFRGYWKGAAAFFRGEREGLVRAAQRLRWLLVATVIIYGLSNAFALVSVIARFLGHEIGGPPAAPG